MNQIGALDNAQYNKLTEWVKKNGFSGVIAGLSEKRFQHLKSLGIKPFAVSVGEENNCSDYFIVIRTAECSWDPSELAKELQGVDPSNDEIMLFSGGCLPRFTAKKWVPRLWTPSHILARMAFRAKGLNYIR